MNDRSNCTVCALPLSGRQTLYCSTKCKNTVHQSYQAQKKRGLERKIRFVTQFGGRCSNCGYAQNLAGLAFHHLEGGSKKFQLDVRTLSNRTIEPILKEVAKCVLLCHNCHAEMHNPGLDLAKLSIKPTALTAELPPLNDLDFRI